MEQCKIVVSQEGYEDATITFKLEEASDDMVVNFSFGEEGHTQYSDSLMSSVLGVILDALNN